MISSSNKTESKIINAFITLRTQKPLEKITVLELSKLAEINKSTFYRHYNDIYDLSNSVESSLIEDALNSLPDPSVLLKPNGIISLTKAFMTQSELFDIVFSGSRKDVAVHKLHDQLIELFYTLLPEYKNNVEKSALLSTLIYGNFYTYFLYKDKDIEKVLNEFSNLSMTLLNN